MKQLEKLPDSRKDNWMRNNTLHMKLFPIHFFLAWFMTEMIQIQLCIHDWDKPWEEPPLSK
jgi:hypothetical protein